MSERKVQRDVLAAGIPGVRLFRNNVGVGFIGRIIAESIARITLEEYRRVAFGLMKGSGDLIGWKTVTVTPEMVGRKIAIFVSIENKSETGGHEREDQKKWIAVVKQFGGLAGFARSVDDARAILDGEI